MKRKSLTALLVLAVMLPSLLLGYWVGGLFNKGGNDDSGEHDGEESLIPDRVEFAMTSFDEYTGDIANPDRGWYFDMDNIEIPVTASNNLPEAFDWDEYKDKRVEGLYDGADVSFSVAHINFGLENFSDNIGGDTQDLTVGALDYIKMVFEKLRTDGWTAIIRFSYDTNGESFNGEEPEPTWRNGIDQQPRDDLYWVRRHISQLAGLCTDDADTSDINIFEEYADVIISMDGGFLGPWGEMHTTAMSENEDNVNEIIDLLLEAVPSERTLSIRYPEQFRVWYNARHGLTGDDELDLTEIELAQECAACKGICQGTRIGMFNDGYLASESDFGSWGDGIDRAQAVQWLQGQTGRTFYGGEYSFEYWDGFDQDSCYPCGVSTHARFWDDGELCPCTLSEIAAKQQAHGIDDSIKYNTIQYLAYEAFRTRTSHLNVFWNPKMVQYLAETLYPTAAYTLKAGDYENLDGDVTVTPEAAYAGKTAFEYVRDRLGYRLVLREAGVAKDDTNLYFRGSMENVGFGNIVNAKTVWAVIKSADTVVLVPTAIDASSWTAGGGKVKLEFAVDLSMLSGISGECEVFLKINDVWEKDAESNLRCIRFAIEESGGLGVWNADLGANLVGKITL